MKIMKFNEMNNNNDNMLFNNITVIARYRSGYKFPVYLTDGKEYKIFDVYNGGKSRGDVPTFHVINDLGILSPCYFNCLGQFWDIKKDNKYLDILERKKRLERKN